MTGALFLQKRRTCCHGARAGLSTWTAPAVNHKREDFHNDTHPGTYVAVPSYTTHPLAASRFNTFSGPQPRLALGISQSLHVRQVTSQVARSDFLTTTARDEHEPRE